MDGASNALDILGRIPVDTSAHDQPALPRRRLLTTSLLTAGALGAGLAAAPAAEANARPTSLQAQWRWCNRCQCLFYGGGTTTAWCILGGGHDYGGSGNYIITYATGTGQPGWRWCARCYCLWYGATASDGRCHGGGGGHARNASGDYIVAFGAPPSGEQPGWRWCNRCYCLGYSGNGNGWCPLGGGHNFAASGAYYLAFG